MRCRSDSMILVTGLRWTVKVWNSWGPDPTVSGCWTITLTTPELVPYAISIQLPLSPVEERNVIRMVNVQYNTIMPFSEKIETKKKIKKNRRSLTCLRCEIDTEGSDGVLWGITVKLCNKKIIVLHAQRKLLDICRKTKRCNVRLI